VLSIAAALWLAASPAPLASPDADFVIFFPRPDRASGLVAFFEAAGRYSVLLQPDSWSPELFPPFQLDLANPGSFSALGLDPSAPLTVNVVGGWRLSCAQVRDPKLWEGKAKARLDVLGDPWKGAPRGVRAAAILRTPVAGYARRGNEVCSTQNPDDAQRLLASAARTLASRAPLPSEILGSPAAAYVWRPGWFALALQGDSRHLEVSGLTLRPSDPSLLPAGPSPYGAMRHSGLFFGRARMAKSSLPELALRLESSLAAACPRCDRRRAIELWSAIYGSLSGDFAYRTDRVEVGESLRTPAARFFAPKEAMVGKAVDPAATRRLLDGLHSWPNARATDRGYALAMDGGEVEVGVSGTHFFLGNDAAAITALLAELPKQGAPLAHGAEFWLDPKLAHRALAQVSLLDLLGSRELAPLVAAGTELGVLLGHSAELSGWMDSAPSGRHRVFFTWALDGGGAQDGRP